MVSQKVKTALSLARKKISLENIKKAESLLDQAAKKRVIPKKRASRLKSRLAKLLKKTKSEKKTKPPKKTKKLKKKAS